RASVDVPERAVAQRIALIPHRSRSVQRADRVVQRGEHAGLARGVGAAEAGPDLEAEPGQEGWPLGAADGGVEAEEEVLLLPHERAAVVGEHRASLIAGGAVGARAVHE